MVSVSSFCLGSLYSSRLFTMSSSMAYWDWKGKDPSPPAVLAQQEGLLTEVVEMCTEGCRMVKVSTQGWSSFTGDTFSRKQSEGEDPHMHPTIYMPKPPHTLLV